MRGLNSFEKECLLDCLRPEDPTTDCTEIAPLYVWERLEQRGLISTPCVCAWGTCAHDETSYPSLTPIGRTLLALHQSGAL